MESQAVNQILSGMNFSISVDIMETVDFESEVDGIIAVLRRLDEPGVKTDVLTLPLHRLTNNQLRVYRAVITPDEAGTFLNFQGIVRVLAERTVSGYKEGDTMRGVQLRVYDEIRAIYDILTSSAESYVSVEGRRFKTNSAQARLILLNNAYSFGDMLGVATVTGRGDDLEGYTFKQRRLLQLLEDKSLSLGMVRCKLAVVTALTTANKRGRYLTGKNLANLVSTDPVVSLKQLGFDDSELNFVIVVLQKHHRQMIVDQGGRGVTQGFIQSKLEEVESRIGCI